MSITEFENYLAELLISTNWFFVDNEDECEAEFNEGYLLVKGRVLPYALTYDKLKAKITILIYKEGTTTPLAVLNYDAKQQRWFGRSFVVGYIQIKPISHTDEWKQLSDIRKFLAGPKPLSLPGVTYSDAKNEVCVVPKYDIRNDFPTFDDTIHPECAIALIACNRLEYFTKCVQALALNPQFNEWPVFLFLDTPVNNQNNAEHITILKEYCPNAHIICRPCNFGIGKNIIDARRQLFDNLKFDYVFIIEEDVIVAPNYFETMINVWSWCVKNEYHNVGCVQGWQNTPTPSSYIDIICDSLWAYSMNRKCWDSIKSLIYEYEEKFLLCKYHERPHRTISKWWDSIKCCGLLKGYPLSNEKISVLNSYMGTFGTSQNWATLLAMYKTGWIRIAPKINLAENIGRIGTCKVEEYDNAKYADVKIQNFETPTEFEESL